MSDRPMPISAASTSTYLCSPPGNRANDGTVIIGSFVYGRRLPNCLIRNLKPCSSQCSNCTRMKRSLK
jgi:hypothetical protein